MRKVAGVGINDAGYPTSRYIKASDGRRKLAWRCPVYVLWSNMLNRCYREGCPTYSDVTVCNEWLLFSNFASWVGGTDITGLQLDKDILDPWNKEYGPHKCMLIPSYVNTLVIERRSNNSKTPNVRVTGTKYESYVSDGSRVVRSKFETLSEANNWWVNIKVELVKSFDISEDIKSKLLGRYFYFLHTGTLL